MRNLILFAIAFGVALSEADVQELGYDVTEVDFKNYFGIPEETTQDEGFKKSENFKVNDLVPHMNETELDEYSAVLKAETDGTIPADEPKSDAKPAKETPEAKKARVAAEKEAAKVAKQKEKDDAKAAKDAAKNAEKEVKPMGVIASILDIILNATAPVGEDEIVAGLKSRFADKGEDSMRNTVRAQIGGKSQPTRMEKEKGITFVITEVPAAEEGGKATRKFAVSDESKAKLTAKK